MSALDAVPIGKNLWKVSINNGTTGPITDLEVDVYLVDESGNRSAGKCLPAKGNISLEDLMRDLMAEGLSGALGAAGQQAQSMYSGLPPGMGFGGMASQFGQLGSYGPMMANQALALPQVSAFLRNVQQQMVDRFLRVVPAGQSADVLYVADPGEVRADIQFADEVGDLWRRPFGERPEPVLVEEHLDVVSFLENRDVSRLVSWVIAIARTGGAWFMRVSAVAPPRGTPFSIHRVRPR